MRYEIRPCAKPRMTRRDKWAKRPVVMKYWAFCDEVRAAKIQIPDHGLHVTFGIPMPKSWSKARRAHKNNQPHQKRGDIDNFVKALLDAVMDEDCGVWNIQASKFWTDSEIGYIQLENKGGNDG